jgi:hypothetical protein
VKGRVGVDEGRDVTVARLLPTEQPELQCIGQEACQPGSVVHLGSAECAPGA